jgi:hypothetical protein
VCAVEVCNAVMWWSVAAKVRVIYIYIYIYIYTHTPWVVLTRYRTDVVLTCI